MPRLRKSPLPSGDSFISRPRMRKLAAEIDRLMEWEKSEQSLLYINSYHLAYLTLRAASRRMSRNDLVCRILEEWIREEEKERLRRKRQGKKEADGMMGDGLLDTIVDYVDKGDE